MAAQYFSGIATPRSSKKEIASTLPTHRTRPTGVCKPRIIEKMFSTAIVAQEADERKRCHDFSHTDFPLVEIPALDNMMRMISPNQILMFRLFCQVSVGVILLYAGGQKIFVSGVSQFAADVEKFQLLPTSVVSLVAYFLPWWEVVTGICLMLGFMRKGAIASGLMMTLMFGGVISWAWSQGLDISCGCFGKSDATIQYPRKISELSLQLIALIIAATGSTMRWTGGPSEKAVKLEKS